MKVPIVNNVSSDIKNFYPTSIKLIKATKNGYRIGKRTADVYHQNKLTDVISCIYKKISKETTIENLPVIAGAVGLLIPIYLVNPILYLAGYITREIILKYRDIKEKIQDKRSSL